jgi:hypothetical protein
MSNWAKWNLLTEPEDRYKLLLEIEIDWDELRGRLAKYYSSKNPAHNLYKFYIGKMIHDGNRDCGLLSYVLSCYKKEGGFPEGMSGWYSSQNTLGHIRNAEVLLELLEKITVNDQ